MKTISRILAGLFTLLLSLQASAQVDSTLINGKYYKIYPIREQINIPSEYWKAVKDKDCIKNPTNYFNVFGEGQYFSQAAFDTSDVETLEGLQKTLKRKWRRIQSYEFGLGPRFKRIVRKNPASIIVPNYQLEQDFIPAFGAIPDGDYVQLFNNFCLTDKKGKCQEQTDRVAAYFSVKNNEPHGYAVWINLSGDTLKEGNFNNGLRDGKWKFHDLGKTMTYLSRWSIRPLKRTGVLYQDTTYSELTYSAGVLDGPYRYINPRDSLLVKGSYTDGKESGNWRSYFNEKLLMNITYADPNTALRSHTPIVRTGSTLKTSRNSNLRGYRYSRYEIPDNFFTFDFGVDEALDLEEEAFQSHELEYDHINTGRIERPTMPTRIQERLKKYFPTNYYFQDYLFDFVLDPNTGYSETHNHFIDSIGAKMLYDGAYEIYYPNGQIYSRYLFENGALKEEGTLYWDNGKPFDKITFNPDSNNYHRQNFDYDGKLMNTAIYDSLGDFIRYDEEVIEPDVLEIDGIVAELDRVEYLYGYPKVYRLFDGNYVYYNEDVLDKELPDSTVYLYRQYNGYDRKTMLSAVTFDPKTRLQVEYKRSYTGNEFYRSERTYAEDFQSWNGKTTVKYGRFKVVITQSAIFDEFYKKDSIPERNILYPKDIFQVTSDTEIYKDGELYTGPVQLKTQRGFFNYSSNKLKLKEGYRERSSRNSRRLAKYLTKGRFTNDPRLGVIMEVEDCSDIEEFISRNFHEVANSSFFYYHGSPRRWGYGSQTKKIKGKMVEGKAQGPWVGKRHGRTTNKIQFDRGEPFGIYEQYGYESRSTRWARLSSYDSLPKTRKFYLNYTQEYINGQKNGPMYDYNWYGRIESQCNYVDGFREGEYKRLSPLAYSVSQYKNGYLDGYIQAFLTLPYHDTLLLYDVNFQNGVLNGESNSYHTNGKLAKRGFFLDGKAIDDYEAYDTLGFRYHYVKFQYGFPVEEKIWEENELSLRYKFNWEDSVEFDPSDITGSPSVESLLSRLGYGGGYYNENYYGRPRLVEKSGLTYHMTKFYPNDTIARIGNIDDGKKIGHWKFYDYYGEFLYEVDYADTIIRLNDSVRFKSKGIYTDVSPDGTPLSKSYIIEKMEKYDCAHTDHYEIRQFYTFWEADDSVGRRNGYVYNFYDNGVLQSEGQMKDGLPTGLWKYYDPFGKLNLMGGFHQGKRHGRWLMGDLEKKKYLGEICLNPDLPNLEREKKYRENLLDLTIITYHLGQTKSKQFYDLDLNKYSNLVNE